MCQPKGLSSARKRRSIWCRSSRAIACPAGSTSFLPRSSWWLSVGLSVHGLRRVRRRIEITRRSAINATKDSRDNPRAGFQSRSTRPRSFEQAEQHFLGQILDHGTEVVAVRGTAKQGARDTVLNDGRQAEDQAIHSTVIIRQGLAHVVQRQLHLGLFTHAFPYRK